MLSPRDKQIIKFMEKYKLGLTIHQASLMFFPQTFAYDYARTRLRNRWEKKFIKRYTNQYSNELIYYLDDDKPTYHDNAVLNVYANLVNLGYKIKTFETARDWGNREVIPDAFIHAYTEGEDGDQRLFFVEVDVSHPTNLQKYEDLYETEEMQNKYGAFPMVLILSDVERNYYSDNIAVVTIDIKCTDFRDNVLI